MGLFKFFGSTPPPENDAKVIEPEAGAFPEQGREAPRFDAVAVLEAAQVDAKQRERVERTLELLAALPSDASPELRKSIVEASLKAFDISIKAIVEAASNELAAFEGFVEHGHRQLEALKQESLARIAELEAEIARIRKHLEVATADQAALDAATLLAADRVRPVLDFFGPTDTQPIVTKDKGPEPSIIVDESLLKTGS